ncbi:MAG: hypothetical protein JO023_18970 [Chloroflexi bacterium]|nr:hypothetical protein [Chloroflexota bacterium]
MEDPGAALAVLLCRPELRHALLPPERPRRPKGPSLLTRCRDAAWRLRAIRVSVRVELPREPSSRVEVSS